MASKNESIPHKDEKSLDNLDYQEDGRLSREENLTLGSRVLTSSGFHAHQKPIVESSFNKARKHGDKMPGNNAERRNYAYLSRLENLIEKHGNPVEKRLWETSSHHNLLIEYDNIPESYWESKRRELRDNGYGDIELTEDYKRELYKEERKLQEQSLEEWANYLGDEHSPYPLWFKVYAWDGMTKMGRYNKAKGGYETRNRTTIAPYPNPDAEVLAMVFDVVNRYYGNGEKEFYTEEGERNIPLERIAQSGNFAKIFNSIQQDIAPVIEPPESAEDIRGEWVEYKLGDEDGIAMAARGTGWCVASPAVGKHYLTYGTYGNDEDEDVLGYDEYYNETIEEGAENKAKFILFHMIDSKTGELAKNACASIRLDPNGYVAEISGLRDGQALDDSMVHIVEEKVKSLPGGEKFLKKFADKNELIRLDHKMQNGENLTVDELRFIYELDRPIAILDTYNNNDPRVGELRDKYNIEYALNMGVKPDDLIPQIKTSDIVAYLDSLISHGVDIDKIIEKLDTHNITQNLNNLLAHGANVNKIVLFLEPYQIGEALDTLVQYGASASDLFSRMEPDGIAYNLDKLLSLGVNIDIDELASKMRPWFIDKYVNTLLAHGANADIVISHMYPQSIADNLDILANYGAHIDTGYIIPRILIGAKELNNLLKYGVDLNGIIDKLHGRSDWITQSEFDSLVFYGANPTKLSSEFQVVDDDEVVEE